jgi:translation initiation factor 3 subunit C
MQDHIGTTDVKVQILFNRAMTALGIAAFRVRWSPASDCDSNLWLVQAGLYADAHECLAEICGSGHTKELLAQGISQPRHGQACNCVQCDITIFTV